MCFDFSSLKLPEGIYRSLPEKPDFTQITADVCPLKSHPFSHMIQKESSDERLELFECLNLKKIHVLQIASLEKA